jgi:hypothetical protein
MHAEHSHGDSAGGTDSTLSGQTWFLNIDKGFCNGNSSCTVLGGKVGVMFEDGTPADPATGKHGPNLQSQTDDC